MPLVEEAQAAARLVRERPYVRILARLDADALCAVALLAHALRRDGRDFHVSWIDRLDAPALERAGGSHDQTLLLVGLDATQNVPPGAHVILQRGPAADAAPAGVALREDASLSALAHLLAVALSARNVDLAPLAIAGALAARRHVGGWRGLDASILDDALATGSVRRDTALGLRGASLLTALSQMDEPFLPGVSGRARNAKKLIVDLGLSADAPPETLSPADAERLGSVLALRLLATGAPDTALDALARPRIQAVKGPHTGQDAADLARLAEAALVTERPGLGLAALWPDETAARELGDPAAAMREELVAALLKAEREIRRDGALAWAEAPRASACVAMADRLALALVADGVALARHRVGDEVRAALRSFGDARDVAAAARRAAEACGGDASGTRGEARATLPASEEERFLKLLAEALA